MSTVALSTELHEEALSAATPERLRALAAQGTQLRRLVASNPAAPTSLLVELSKNADTETRRRVASNPGAPIGTLMELIVIAPLQVAHNPSLTLALLVDPQLIRRTLYARLRPLIDSGGMPLFLQREAAAHPDRNVRLRLALSRDCPAELLAHLASDPTPSVRAEVAANPNTPQAVLVVLASDPAPEVRKALDDQPSPSAELTEALTREPPRLDDASLASFRLTPQLAELLQGISPGLQQQLLAQRSQGLRGVCFSMVNSPHLELRLRVARHSKAGVRFARSLAVDPEPSVRAALAAHLTLDKRILDYLARDRNATVREAVARHPRLPSKNQPRLAADPVAAVRAAVASRHDLFKYLQDTLAQDPSPLVRKALASPCPEAGPEPGESP